MEIEIEFYITPFGRNPFDDWFESTRETHTKSKILARLARLKLGNFGDCKLIKDGEGILELRINYGPGYRVYLGRKGLELVILLIGGDKGSQTKDITKAKQYWRTFKEK